MSELERLVAKHRANGLLIDTNLFLLLLVGTTNEQRIAKFSRTQQYTVGDFRRLSRLMAQFRNVFTTPHVLTEVSNLARLEHSELTTLRTKFRTIVDKTNEIFATSSSVMGSDLFARFGLTDAAIANAAQRPMLVLTDDLPLYQTLVHQGVDAINFNHIRTL